MALKCIEDYLVHYIFRRKLYNAVQKLWGQATFYLVVILSPKFLNCIVCIWPLLQFYADFTIIIFLLFQCHCSTSKKICGNGCHWDCKRRSHNYNCAVCWVLRTYCQPCQLSQIIWLSLDCQGHTMSSWLHFELSKG